MRKAAWDLMNLLERAKTMVNGASTLALWLGSGGMCVSQETAQKRTDICLVCPMNQEGNQITESVAQAIKEQVELKNHLGLKTQGIKSLKSCKACDCFLPLKIFVPLERILPNEDEKSKLHPACWLLHEKP